ncbi:hypothetical protein QL285_008787 [Trifolium repens]|nr:hypothetical protein QL285_008787 [Trifolium repens]
MMKNGKISHFFKRKACENASTSEPIEVPRINEMITSTPQQVEVPPIEEVTIATPQQVEVPSIEEVSTTTPQQIEVPSIEEVTITSQRVVVPDDILNSLERSYRAFNIDTISTLVERYYPMDFNEQDKITLQFQLRQFLVDARQSTDLKNLSTIQNLCSCLVATNRDKIYFLIDRLLRLIMTLPVSTATTKRRYSFIGAFIGLPRDNIMNLCMGTKELSITILQVWLIYLHRHCMELGNNNVYGFIDPHFTHSRNEHGSVQSYIQKKIGRIKKIYEILDTALATYNKLQRARKQKKVDWLFPTSQKQKASYECGYFIMIHMLNIVSATLVGSWTQIFGDSQPFKKDEVKNVQERCENIILEHIEANTDNDMN